MTSLTRLARTVLPVALALATVPAVATAQLTVAGSTAGCFGAGCNSFSGSATYGASGLSFTGGTFGRTLYGPSDFDFVTLGSMRLIEDPQNTITDGTFRLRVTFSSPATAAQSIFTAEVDGHYRTGMFANDDASIAFGGPQTITFAGGSFDLWVFDVDLHNSLLNPSDADPIVGKVYNWQPNGGGSAGSVVPEPSTYALLGTGIAALGLLARRRRNMA